MISEVDLRDWEPVEIKKLLTAIEFNYVYNGKESPFGKKDMDVLMKFCNKAEEVRKNLVPQIPALFKAKEGDDLAEPTFLGFSATTWEQAIKVSQ